MFSEEHHVLEYAMWSKYRVFQFQTCCTNNYFLTLKCYTDKEGMWLYVTLCYCIKENDVTLKHDLNVIGSYII